LANSAPSGWSPIVISAIDLILTRHRQIRQGIANNTKGTAFVVYEDVMDAKQACDKLNGFNFQNRYLVGKQPCPPICHPAYANSLIPPTRQDAPVERGSRSPEERFRAAQKAARYRITSGRAHGIITNPTRHADQARSREPVITEGQCSRYANTTWG